MTSQSPPPEERPIFVVGSMRSGSTLLRLILDAHPDIAIGEETGFMGALAANKSIPSWRYGRDWYGRLGWSEEEFESRLREFYSGMFRRYAESQGKRRWGDKTPLHSWHMDDMARIFPGAVFLGIVRHPGAVVASLEKRFHYAAQEAADYWQNTNAEVLRQGARLGDTRFAMVRYEDVLSDPEMTLREVTQWLAEQWSPALLHHNEVQVAKGAPRLVDGHGNYTFGLTEQSMFHEIDVDRIDRQRGMDITIVTTATNDDEGRALLRQLGFPFREN